MKTRGTNPGTMSDADLRACIRAAALELYEAALPADASCYELNFAAGTIQRLTHELRLRCVDEEPSPLVPDSLLDTKIPLRPVSMPGLHPDLMG